jgi:hypothetical protein
MLVSCNHPKIMGCSMGHVGTQKRHTGILHNSDTNVIEQQLNSEVTAEYNLGPQTVTRQARQIFRPGLNKLLLLPPAAKQAWLIRGRNARAQFAELATTRQTFSAEQSGMAQWLQPQGITQRHNEQTPIYPTTGYSGKRNSRL